jgi:hypothetical protein
MLSLWRKLKVTFQTKILSKIKWLLLKAKVLVIRLNDTVQG